MRSVNQYAPESRIDPVNITPVQRLKPDSRPDWLHHTTLIKRVNPDFSDLMFYLDGFFFT